MPYYIFYVALLIPLLCLLDGTNSNPWVPQTPPATNWLNHGGNIYNQRYASSESLISPLTASKLRLKWSFYAGNDVSATPAVFDGVVYFPSWNGNIYAVNQLDGSLVWKKNLQALTGLASTNPIVNITVSRGTPTVADDKLIVPIYGPAYVVAVRRSNGQLLWKTRLDDHPAAVITMSGTYLKRALYVGVSSLEEVFTAENCCTFRGSFTKVDIQTGAILWRTYMLPDNGGNRGGYAGAAIWGSSPSIDSKRNQVYVATGNLYSVPESVESCQERQNNQTSPPAQPEQCVPSEVHFDSMLALDLDSGAIKWFRQLGGYDVWYFACRVPNNPDCPPGPNPDADFGEAPMMLTVAINRSYVDIVVAVQKSGFAWALNQDNGNIVWYTEAGPGGTSGGGTWGSATDNVRIYTNIANNEAKNFTLRPSRNVTTGGGWVAMDAKTGEILWSTPLPYNATANGPVTVANGVLFAGSTYGTGPVYAINAASGKILWSYETGATVYGGFSVSRGCAYVGQGYRNVPQFTAGSSIFAFCV